MEDNQLFISFESIKAFFSSPEKTIAWEEFPPEDLEALSDKAAVILFHKIDDADSNRLAYHNSCGYGYIYRNFTDLKSGISNIDVRVLKVYLIFIFNCTHTHISPQETYFRIRTG